MFHQLPGESLDQTLERAEREGRTGRLIVMPPPISAAQWEAEAIAQQQELAQRAEVYMRHGGNPFA